MGDKASTSGKQQKDCIAPKRPAAHRRIWARWVFLFLLLVYSLALAMTAFEIDAFQTLVGQLSRSNIEVGATASNLEQRELLQAVRRTLAPHQGMVTSGPERRDEASLERIIVHLDDLHAAVDLLEEMKEGLTFRPRTGEAFERARIDDFRVLMGRIGATLKDLRTEVGARQSDKKGSITSKKARKAFESTRERLNNLNTEIAKLDALVGATASGGTSPADRLKSKGTILASDLESALGAFNKALESLAPGATETPEELEKAVRRLQQLDEGQLAVLREQTGLLAGETVTDRLERLQVPLDERKFLRVLYVFGIQNSSPAGRYPAAPPAQDGPSVGPRRLSTYIENFQVDTEGITADGSWGSDTRDAVNKFVEDCNKTGCLGSKAKEPGSIPIEDQIRTLRDGLSSLQTELPDGANEAAREHLVRVADLGGALARAEVAVQRLGQLEVGATSGGSGDLADAGRMYQQAVSDLEAVIEGLRESLRNQNGLIVIADAIGKDDERRHQKAQFIASEFDALNRYQRILTPLGVLVVESPNCDPTVACSAWRFVTTVWNHIANIGFHAKDMATMTRQALDMMVVFVMGAIGSLIYIIRYLLSQTLKGHESDSPVWRPFSWFVFRPLFGIVVAFAIYLLYKTGQVALGGVTSNVLASDINLPMLSIFSLFAGLLSWQALEMVETKGRVWLSSQQRENLYASGLNQALRNGGKTISDCAAQVGVTPTQVDRWVAGQDKVTPEMQDRMTTWLDRARVEIFGDRHPREMQGDSMAWATGLEAALKDNRTGTDLQRLAAVTEQDVGTVHAWVELKRQLDPEMQFLIADALCMEWGLLFSYERPDADYWATGLRNALSAAGARHRDAASLAAEVGSTTRNIRAYMELEEGVPKTLRDRIAKALGLEQDKNLITPNLPLDSEFKWAAKLREYLRKSPIEGAADLAERVDTETIWVRAWMEQEIGAGEEEAPFLGQVAPATQQALAKALDCSPEDLFRAERALSDFRWVRMPVFSDRVEERGGVGALASRLDLDVARVERWLAGAEPVAMETELELLGDFGLPVEERDSLFTSNPPPDPARSKGAWWATGLRAAVREHPGMLSLGRLAAQLEVPVGELYDQAELLAPVTQDRRDSISRILGPITAGGDPLFSTQVPDWSKYRWVPGLRSAMMRTEVEAAELATALDVELARVRDWMEKNEEDVDTRWVKGKVKRGQLPPTMLGELAEAINAFKDAQQPAVTVDELRSEVADATGVPLYARKPALRTAIDALEDGLDGLARRIDAEPSRVARWVDQQELVLPRTQDAILEELGLTRAEADRDQLFRRTTGVDEALG